MPKKINLVYLWSLRNAAADQAGQPIDYKGGTRYMKSPLEFLVESLNSTPLGDLYQLTGIIYDDDAGSPRDCEKIGGYGFKDDDGFHYEPGRPWFFPPDLAVRGRRVNDLLCAVPSTYRRLPLAAPERGAGKHQFEQALLQRLRALGAELVVVDGLLVILDELVRPDSPYYRRMVNIHPGITRLESPYERRGACATLDALYGARGQKVLDWATLATAAVPPLMRTGASFHYMDTGIDSGEVIVDVLGTAIDPADTILELRWNNFNQSLFPALHQGLLALARQAQAETAV